MKILLTTHAFNPQVGGLETVARLLAFGFIAAGHEVHVCTRSPGTASDDLGLVVIRNPSRAEYRAEVRWADIVLQNNISLPWALPLVLRRKRWVCANHDWPRADDGSLDFRARLKLAVSRLASAQTAVSEALARQLPGRSIVVGNPYDASFFRSFPGVTRDREVFFLGRLFDGKGVDTLLRAVARLPAVRLTVVGRGPEAANLEALAGQLGVSDRVAFRGALFGDELIEEMNRHRLCVVPSRLRESFGIVALEAMATGCVVIGSDLGGVPEAVGPGGPLFPAEDPEALSALISDLLGSEERMQAQRVRQVGHLGQFGADAVAERYLEIFERVLAE